MKTKRQLIEQYERIRQQCIYDCWDGWNYTGRGEYRLKIIEAIFNRYLDNMIKQLGRFTPESCDIPVSRELYMM